LKVATWNESANGESTSFYAISLDGESMATVRETTYELKLRHGEFDPKHQASMLRAGLTADDQTTLYIVQFVSQPLQQYRDVIAALGGSVHHYLAKHAHIVEMDAVVAEAVAALPFVRWVGPYHPEYRLEEPILEKVVNPDASPQKQRYHIQVVRRGLQQKLAVAERVEALGGVVHELYPEGSIFDATLMPDQLAEVVRMNEVFFIDRWLPPQTYMNNVREDGGANQIESVAGYTGAGVRAEVMDSGLLTSHQAFAIAPIVHTCNSSDTSHGTSVYGINFGDGTGNASGHCFNGHIESREGVECRI